jgi:two-component system NtrC family response regulator
MARVLVIEHDGEVCRNLLEIIEGIGHEAVCAKKMSDALSLAEMDCYDLLILDEAQLSADGMAALPGLKLLASQPEIVLLVGEESRGIDIVYRTGAWDFLSKPLSQAAVGLCLRRVLRYRESLRDRHTVRAMRRPEIPGDSEALMNVLDRLAESVDSPEPLVISGEKGTGKDVFARCLHENSRRFGNSFVVFDCSRIPEELAECLFDSGMEAKKVFGAEIKEGLRNGTLFMDGLPFLPDKTQERLSGLIGSKPLQEGNGFKLVVSMDENVNEMVDKGRLNKNLAEAFRENVLEIPPLRRRKQDISAMALKRVQELAGLFRATVKGLSGDFLSALERYDWPGNDGELYMVVSKAFQFAGSHPLLLAEHLPERLGGRLAREAEVAVSARLSRDDVAAIEKNFPSFREYRENLLAGAERSYLEDVIRMSGGRHSRAEEISGLSRSRLYELLGKYELSFKSVVKPKQTE